MCSSLSPRSPIGCCATILVALSTLPSQPVAADPVNGTWDLLSTPSSPPGTRDYAAIYDPVHHRVVMFGGLDSDTVLSDRTFVLDLNGPPDWTELQLSGSSPSARQGHRAIYDPVRERMIVFGGYDTTWKDDVWALSLSDPPEWTELPVSGDGPSARMHHGLIYDPVRDRLVVVCGGPGWLGDIWVLPLSEPLLWTQVIPPGAWVWRAGHTTIYDPVRDRLILFAGHAFEGSGNDVWALTLAGTPAWSPLNSPGARPSPRTYHTAIYDPILDRMIVFAGWSGSSAINDLWALSLSGTPTWTNLLAGEPEPSPRDLLTAVYDSAEDRMVVYGGWTGNQFLNDTWVLDWNRTTAVEPTVATMAALHGARPNPAVNDLSVAFSLPDGQPTRVELHDVQGRRILAREVGSLGPGSHTVRMGDIARLSSGLYFIRLVRADRSLSAKVMILD